MALSESHKKDGIGEKNGGDGIDERVVDKYSVVEE